MIVSGNRNYKNALEKVFGYQGSALKRLQEYFTGTSYTIEINGIKSSKQVLEIGVGQGGGLSGKEFSMATNEIGLIPGRHDIKCFQYCDDLYSILTFNTNQDGDKMKVQLLNCYMK